MIILGIETSCDETAASVVRDGREILSHVLATSADMHIKTGGVIPEQAAREQIKSIIPVVELALKEGCGWDVDKSLPPPIEAIAVTIGPGLIGSLLVGVETAKSLAFVWGKPIVPVNHLLAHLYANWLHQSSVLGDQLSANSQTVISQSVTDKQKTGKPNSENKRQKTDNRNPKLPAVGLVVSGGHTDLVYIKGHGDLEYIGGTRDDAVGEALDKTSRLLGIKAYLGGPVLAQTADSFRKTGRKISFPKLPRPMADSLDFDFSFSGLKTAVARLHSNNPGIPIEELAYEIQESVTDVLVQKTLAAVKKYKAPTLLLAGGVAANSRLREKFEFKIKNLELKIDFCVPPPRLCTDNASYIAACAEFNYHPMPWQKIEANPSLTIMSSPALR